MSHTTLYALDLAAIALLVFGIYFPRHRRRDMVVAYLGVNVGVLVVAGTLATSAVGAGLGLGLFGVLSIIRLRSDELGQREVAYYFAALTLGLLGGIAATPSWLNPVGMVLVLAALWVGDHPRLLARHRSQVMVLDRAFTDEAAALTHLERMLGTTVRSATIQRVDLVNDTTVVDVRYEVRRDPAGAPTAEATR